MNSASTYTYIFVRFSNDLKWAQFHRPHHCTEMAFCTTRNNQKTENFLKCCGAASKLHWWSPPSGISAKSEIFSMWTQCNVAFKIHLLIHFSSCKTCSSQCLSSVSELHSVHKRWFCILKLYKIKVFYQNLSLWFHFFGRLKIETLLDCRPTIGSWRHCACIVGVPSSLFYFEGVTSSETLVLSRKVQKGG